MAAYKDLVGQKITSVTSNPPEPKTGQMWYNSSAAKLRGLAITEAWASAAPLSTGRYGAAGGGPQTAAITAAGNTQTGTTATTEFYDGTGWSTSTDINTSRGALGSSKDGSQTAHLVFGGTSNSTASESWNGSSWTATPALNTGKNYTSGAGTSTAALNAGRWGPPLIGNTEEYNGSSWSEQNDLSTARGDMGSFGTQTAAIFTGGNKGSPPNYANDVEQYDGSSWTTLPNLNTARGMGGSGAGSATSGLVFGGNTPGPANSAASESWDGSSWTNTPSLGDSGTKTGSGASGSAALAYGDYPVTGVTEEFTKSTNTITAAVWSSGANYPATIQDAAGCGPVTAAAIYGGYTSTYTNATNEYDGTSYSGGGNMNTGRATYQTGTGSQTAALQAGGYATSSHTNASEEYNGTSWSEGNNLTYSRYSAVGGGVQTSSLIIGGNGGPSPSSPNAALDKTEEYDGTSWTAGGDLPAAQAGGSGFSGTSSSSAIIAGFSPPNTVTLSYNGSSWTDLGHALVQAVGNPAGGSQQGTSTAAVIAGGLTPAPAHTTFAQQYDGTSWVSAPSMSTARRGGAASGTAASCLAVGGESPQKNNTEEFTGEVTAANIEDFTTS